MNRHIANLTTVVGLLVIAFQSHAEGGCPPGHYPQQGQGWQTCIPAPGYGGGGSSPPPPAEVWEDRWGALAEDEKEELAGASRGSADRATAEARAVSDCEAYGHSGCRSVTYYKNQCIAVVGGNVVANVRYGTSEHSAVQSGMKTCQAEGQTGCFVVYSGCSLPVRIR